jgi:predicted metal-dependent hydrolase
LEKQLFRHASRSAEPKVWTAGTEILFRGQKVPLHVTEEQRTAIVRFAGEAVHLSIQTEGLIHTRGQQPGIIDRTFLPQAESLPHNFSRVPANLRPSVEKHLWQLASRELPLRVTELAKQHAFPVQRVSVRNQRSRWGSCSKHGTISLNWRLVQTPLFVRDYIILHELAHLKEMNHSRRFWREVARLCPDFARAERWLKEHAALFR